jgi:hypothetical protein
MATTLPFLHSQQWVAHEPLNFGSYVVRVRGNCTVGQNFGVTSHLYLSGVPRRRLADLPRFLSFEDVEFPLE